MADYQIRILDGAGAYIGSPMACESDIDAIERLTELTAWPRRELWCGDRLVTRIGPAVP